MCRRRFFDGERRRWRIVRVRSATVIGENDLLAERDLVELVLGWRRSSWHLAFSYL
jgi:hypothetical protein